MERITDRKRQDNEISPGSLNPDCNEFPASQNPHRLVGSSNPCHAGGLVCVPPETIRRAARDSIAVVSRAKEMILPGKIATHCCIWKNALPSSPRCWSSSVRPPCRRISESSHRSTASITSPPPRFLRRWEIGAVSDPTNNSSPLPASILPPTNPERFRG